jgi:hypothetical protein
VSDADHAGTTLVLKSVQRFPMGLPVQQVMYLEHVDVVGFHKLERLFDLSLTRSPAVSPYLCGKLEIRLLTHSCPADDLFGVSVHRRQVDESDAGLDAIGYYLLP